MADQQQHAPGGHYSGANPVPTIQKFVESLDKDKKERDKRVEEERKRKLQGEATPHQPGDAAQEGTRKTVTDPTTGREVVIEDANKDHMKASENPQVGIDN